MRTVLVTGARGFVGRNLGAHLRRRDDVRLVEIDVDSPPQALTDALAGADVVFHLAGTNRPRDVAEFHTGNTELTQAICQTLTDLGRAPRIVFSSSIQAAADNPYGQSKKAAEDGLAAFARQTGAPVSIHRLKNVFGKWCRPNYNSVVATFCHNVAHDLPIQVSDPSKSLELVHVDDVVAEFLAEMDRAAPSGPFAPEDRIPSYTLTLGDLAGRVQAFHEMQTTLRVPDFSVRFNQQLYGTYLSYLEPERWRYGLDIKADARGNLAEFIKSPWFGQVFVSRTLPGVTRGNHFHHTKTEKFFVVEGEGLIRFRQIDESEVREIRVRGRDYQIVEIPPGHTHSITNVGQTEMITLFWASEIFDPDRPDTHFLPVDPGASP